eukprot:gene3237-5680_t
MTNWIENTVAAYQKLGVVSFDNSNNIKGYTAWVEVRIQNLIHNYRFFDEKQKKIFGNDVVETWPVVKAKAYGHLMEIVVPPVAFFLKSKNQIPKFCVHRADGAFELANILKKCGFDNFLVNILSPAFEDQFEQLISPNFQVQFVEKSSAFLMNDLIGKMKKDGKLEKNFKQKITIHINSGMNRLGFDVNSSDGKLLNQLSTFGEEVKEIYQNCENLKIESLTTHFSVADDKKSIEFTQGQLDRLLKSVENLKELGLTIPGISFANSSCLILLDDVISKYFKKRIEKLGLNVIGRPGISFYGLPASGDTVSDEIKLVGERIACKVQQVRFLNKGETVSYGNTPVPEDGYYATIPMGYGDGVRRETKNPHIFLINGKKCEVIGRVCMDQCIAKTDENCKFGDRALFLGDELSILDVVERTETISYTILTAMPSRPQRIAILE